MRQFGFGDAVVVHLAGGVLCLMLCGLVSVAGAADPNIVLEALGSDDSGFRGDGDGDPEPGEQPALHVTLSNVSNTAATGVSATLSSSSSGVVITRAQAGFPDLPDANSVATSHTPFEVRISPSLGCQTLEQAFAPGALLGSTANRGLALISVDPNTGTGAFIADQGAFGSVTEMEIRDDGVLFGTTGGGTRGLIRIDPISGEESLVGLHEFGSITGLEFVGSTLYGTWVFFPNTASQLVMIDTDTAALTFIGPTGFMNVGGLAYDESSGTMYGSLSGGFGGDLITIDLNSGIGTLVGPTGFDDVAALEFGPDGTLYGGLGGNNVDPLPGNLIAIDPNSGTGSLIGPSGYPSLSGLAFVPEPGLFEVKRTVLDFELDIATDQGEFGAQFSLSLGTQVVQQFFMDHMEGGANGWTATGEWHQTQDRSASPTTSWYFGNENGPGLADNAYTTDSQGDLTSPAIDLTAATKAELILRHYLDRELGFDFGILTASDDGFGTAALLATPQPELDPSFGELRRDLSSFVGSSNVQLRFSFDSDNLNTLEGWYVDDVRVESTQLVCDYRAADHYSLYAVRRLEDFPRFGPIHLEDLFVSKDYKVLNARKIGLPTNKNGEGVRDPNTHWVEYRIKSVRKARFRPVRGLRVRNQCTDLPIRLTRPGPFRLWLPSHKDPNGPVGMPDPNAHELDAMTCYRARYDRRVRRSHRLPAFPQGIQVDLSDQFATRRYELRGVSKFCTPTSVSGDPVLLQKPNRGTPKPITPSGVRNPERHWLCYRAGLARRYIAQDGCGLADPNAPGTNIPQSERRRVRRQAVHVNNDFGPLELRTKSRAWIELCVPSDLPDGIPAASPRPDRHPIIIPGGCF